jgi:hypothetical protein
VLVTTAFTRMVGFAIISALAVALGVFATGINDIIDVANVGVVHPINTALHSMRGKRISITVAGHHYHFSSLFKFLSAQTVPPIDAFSYGHAGDFFYDASVSDECDEGALGLIDTLLYWPRRWYHDETKAALDAWEASLDGAIDEFIENTEHSLDQDMSKVERGAARAAADQRRVDTFWGAVGAGLKRAVRSMVDVFYFNSPSHAALTPSCMFFNSIYLIGILAVGLVVGLPIIVRAGPGLVKAAWALVGLFVVIPLRLIGLLVREIRRAAAKRKAARAARRTAAKPAKRPAATPGTRPPAKRP